MPLVLPPYTPDLATVNDLTAPITVTAPRWILCVAGLLCTSTINHLEDLNDRETLPLEPPIAAACRRALDNARRTLAQATPPPINRRAARTAMAALVNGPRTLHTRAEFRALPNATSGLCIKLMDHSPDRWGVAILTDLGRRALAALGPSHA